jgi:hypothetical protein
MDTAVWLRSIGLAKYETLFRKIGESVLLILTAEHLKELGAASFGHSRNLPARSFAVFLILLALLLPIRSLAVSNNAIAVAVADFDNFDTSDEAADRTAQHAARVQDFGRLLRDGLADAGNYQVVDLQCTRPTCSVGDLGAEGLVAVARHAGASLLIYGGIHKVSTLVQWGELQVVDLDREQLLLRRSFTFRGDSEEAFRHAASFIRQSLQSIQR